MATIESLLRKPKVSDEQKVRQCRQAINSNRRSFEELLNAVLHPDPSVRISAARIIDAVTEEDPTVAFEYKNSLIYKMAKVEQSEIRRHIAAVIPRLELSEREYIDVAAIYADYLSSRDKNVKDVCLQAIDLFLEMSYPEDSKLAQKFLTQLKALKQRHGPQPEQTVATVKPAVQAPPLAAVTPPVTIAQPPKPAAQAVATPAPASGGSFAPRPAAPPQAGFAPKPAAAPAPSGTATPIITAAAPVATPAAPAATPSPAPQPPVAAAATPAPATTTTAGTASVSAPSTGTPEEAAKPQTATPATEQPLQAVADSLKDKAV